MRTASCRRSPTAGAGTRRDGGAGGVSFASRWEPTCTAGALQAKSEGVCGKSRSRRLWGRGASGVGGRWSVGTVFLFCKTNVLLTLLNCTLKSGEDAKLFGFFYPNFKKSIKKIARIPNPQLLELPPAVTLPRPVSRGQPCWQPPGISVAPRPARRPLRWRAGPRGPRALLSLLPRMARGLRAAPFWARTRLCPSGLAVPAEGGGRPLVTECRPLR